jgi:hypothetical protein
LRPRIPNPAATIIVALLFLVANVGNAVYFAFGLAPSLGFLLLYYVGFAWAMSNWVLADSRRTGVPSAIDQGCVTFAAWPIVVPYHLIRTRGWKSSLVILGGFAGLFLLTYLLSLIVYFAVVKMRGF